MGRAKKRYYKLAATLRREHPDWTPLRAYEKAIDLDQRRQAALQVTRWRNSAAHTTPPKEDS